MVIIFVVIRGRGGSDSSSPAPRPSRLADLNSRKKVYTYILLSLAPLSFSAFSWESFRMRCLVSQLVMIPLQAAGHPCTNNISNISRTTFRAPPQQLNPHGISSPSLLRHPMLQTHL